MLMNFNKQLDLQLSPPPVPNIRVIALIIEQFVTSKNHHSRCARIVILEFSSKGFFSPLLSITKFDENGAALLLGWSSNL